MTTETETPPGTEQAPPEPQTPPAEQPPAEAPKDPPQQAPPADPPADPPTPDAPKDPPPPAEQGTPQAAYAYSREQVIALNPVRLAQGLDPLPMPEDELPDCTACEGSNWQDPTRGHQVGTKQHP